MANGRRARGTAIGSCGTRKHDSCILILKHYTHDCRQTIHQHHHDICNHQHHSHRLLLSFSFSCQAREQGSGAAEAQGKRTKERILLLLLSFTKELASKARWGF